MSSRPMGVPNWDDTYGVLIEAQPSRNDDDKPWKTWEELHTPSSRCKLEATSVAQLSLFMKEVELGWRLGLLLVHDVLLIWVVDEAGDIWFAIEELIVDGRPTGHPRHISLLKQLGKAQEVDKLGHPSLIFCKKGRIGGEIYFDTGVSPPEWVINPYSGRYGIHPTRELQHLRNAANRFSGLLGIDFKPDETYFRSRKRT